MSPIDIIWDMETNDPDDFLTLCFFAAHPRVNLRAVTVMPGSDAQVGIVRRALHLLGQGHIPVGSCSPGYEKNVVSEFHYQFLGDVPRAKADGVGHEVIMDTLRKFPRATLVTGAPLKTFRPIATELVLERWIAQGGFAGDSVVPEEYRLDKFKGRETCPTFNFNGDPKTALAMLGSPKIREVFCVSKNVCHGVVYDGEFHQRVARVTNRNAGLEMIYRAMEVYLKHQPEGKLLHDPLAACVALDQSVCEFREVEVYRERGEWGSRLSSGTGRFISVRHDAQKFFKLFTAQI